MTLLSFSNRQEKAQSGQPSACKLLTQPSLCIPATSQPWCRWSKSKLSYRLILEVSTHAAQNTFRTLFWLCLSFISRGWFSNLMCSSLLTLVLDFLSLRLKTFQILHIPNSSLKKYHYLVSQHNMQFRLNEISRIGESTETESRSLIALGWGRRQIESDN